MSITQRELEIANKSYTNKDFETIYMELLDYAEKLSTRFSPANSNESDPFVILLKLVAFVADKINYNVDKNTLERFMLSCTQERSMRELTSMLGYNMKYYRSAETSVIFKYKFSEEELAEANGLELFIPVPKYSSVTNSAGAQFITLSNASISSKTGVSEEVAAIQGVLKELTVLDSNLIQLENLNSKNIVYFPEPMVAENGVFIYNSIGAEDWKSVYNLNTQIYGSTVFKFGFDSIKNLPYIEFPQWISEIIGEGLQIKYIVTEGITGNINAKSLTSVTRNFSSSNETDPNHSDSDIYVTNNIPAVSGGNPETIDHSYEGFKKIIGTFDTLVTCRDYANALYNLTNVFGNNYVSNVVAADRRIDINRGCEVLSTTSNGTQSRSIISKKVDKVIANISDDEKREANKDKIYYVQSQNKYYKCKKMSDNTYDFIEYSLDELEDEIIANDLYLYPLNPITNTSPLAIDDENGYNNSYRILKKSKVDDMIGSPAFTSYKTMSHEFKTLKENDIFNIINYQILNGIISTNTKVNVLEEADIIANINNALISRYNPRHLNFGDEIVFDDLLKTIQNADVRIKSVSLQEPKQVTKIATIQNAEGGDDRKIVEYPIKNTDNSATDQFKFIVAKNLLAGRISAFEYDNDFEYSYLYQDSLYIPDVLFLETQCKIPTFNNTNKEYTLNPNEVIQFIAPSMHTDVTFPYGVEYCLILNAIGDDVYIPKDSLYKLGAGEKIIFTYLDNNDRRIIVKYEQGDIICPNLNLYDTRCRVNSKNNTQNEGQPSNVLYPTEFLDATQYPFFTLDTKDEVAHKTVNKETIKSYRKCYWLTNSEHNEIKWIRSANSGDLTGYYILEDDEYFFITDNAASELFAYGSGTKIFLSNVLTWEWKHDTYLTADSINEKGLQASSDYFVDRAFDNTSYLTITQNDIITIVGNDTINVTSKSLDEFNLTIPDNTFADIDDDIKIAYKIESESGYTDLPDRSTLIGTSDDINYGWKVRAILDINSGPQLQQKLYGNQEMNFTHGVFSPTHQKYIAKTVNDVVQKTTIKASDELNFFKFNSLTQRSGGSKVDLQYLDLNLKYRCPSIFAFKLSNVANSLVSYDNGFNGLTFRKTDDTDDQPSTIERTLYVRPSNIGPYETQTIIGETISFQKTVDGQAIRDRYVMLYIDGLAANKFIYLTAYDKNASGTAAIITNNCVTMFNSICGNVYRDENQQSLQLGNGLHIIKISENKSTNENLTDNCYEKLCSHITLSLTGTKTERSKVSILLSDLKMVKGFNPYLGISDSDNIISYMKNKFPIQFENFNIVGNLDPSKQIEVTSNLTLNSPISFYDANNIANKWTIAKIDFNNSALQIARNSKK